MNRITELLDLEDSDIVVSDIRVEGRQKTLTLETPPAVHYCPKCGFRMHSRGIKMRRISHPILQDGYELFLLLKQRRWRCTNPNCSYETNEEFRFVSKNRRITNAADILIVFAFKDLSESASSIARRFHTSDTYVLDVFDRFVNMDRLPLTDIISIDEVHIDMDPHCKYALVIQDFHTGEPIDILRSRRADITEPYFASIPPAERSAVKYLLTDMYNPYLAYVDKYFPNAVSVVDSFHVVQWVLRSIDLYIRSLVKNYRQKQREAEEKKAAELGHPVSLPLSDELCLLQKYRWLILSNRNNITYYSNLRMDPHFHRLMNTYDYESSLFRISPRLRDLRDWKERYIQFNTRNAGHPLKAQEEIEDLIDFYYKTGDEIFVGLASLLSKYRDPIINSFIMVEKNGPGGIYDSRLSNGPVESLNRKVKDLKRMGRGFRSFEHFRNRFLYSTRSNPPLIAVQDNNSLLNIEDDDPEV